jgi:hypothetical protein
VIGADAVITVCRRLGCHCLDQAAGGLRRGLGLLLVPGGDLPGLPAYLLLADPQPLQRACGRALVLGGQAEQEVAGAPVAMAVVPGLPEGDGGRVAGGLVKGRNPVVRVWMPGVCLRAGLTAASWVRMTTWPGY